MAGEGRRFKICSSCMLLLLTVTIIFFGETTVRQVKVEIEEWSEEAKAKQLITQRIHSDYNLKKALAFRNNFFGMFTSEVRKYYVDSLSDLSPSGMDSLSHII